MRKQKRWVSLLARACSFRVIVFQAGINDIGAWFIYWLGWISLWARCKAKQKHGWNETSLRFTQTHHDKNRLVIQENLKWSSIYLIYRQKKSKAPNPERLEYYIIKLLYGAGMSSWQVMVIMTVQGQWQCVSSSTNEFFTQWAAK